MRYHRRARMQTCHIASYGTKWKKRPCVYCVQKIRCSRDKASITNRITIPIPEHNSTKLTTRTLAPNARGGRLERNFDLTTPDEPCGLVTRLNTNSPQPRCSNPKHSENDSPPDHTDFRALDFPLGLVDVCDALVG